MNSFLRKSPVVSNIVRMTWNHCESIQRHSQKFQWGEGVSEIWSVALKPLHCWRLGALPPENFTFEV